MRRLPRETQFEMLDGISDVSGLTIDTGFDELLHGVVRRLDDAGTEKQAFDIIPAVKLQR